MPQGSVRGQRLSPVVSLRPESHRLEWVAVSPTRFRPAPGTRAETERFRRLGCPRCRALSRKHLCGADDWLDWRGCLDHVVVIGERHLLGILSKYVDYAHSA